MGSFLAIWKPVSLSKRTPLHGVSAGVSVNKLDTSNAGQTLLHQQQEWMHCLTECSCVMWPLWIIRGRITVWLLGYRQENQGTVIQLSEGRQVCPFSRASRQAVQTNYTSIQCGPRALSPVGTAASVYSAETKNEWRNTSTPIHVYGVHRYNSYFQKSMGCTCRMQEKRHKLFQAHLMKRTKALM